MGRARLCRECKEPFTPSPQNASKARFCSDRCRRDWERDTRRYVNRPGEGRRRSPRIELAGETYWLGREYAQLLYDDHDPTLPVIRAAIHEALVQSVGRKKYYREWWRNAR